MMHLVKKNANQNVEVMMSSEVVCEVMTFITTRSEQEREEEFCHVFSELLLLLCLRAHLFV